MFQIGYCPHHCTLPHMTVHPFQFKSVQSDSFQNSLLTFEGNILHENSQEVKRGKGNWARNEKKNYGTFILCKINKTVRWCIIIKVTETMMMTITEKNVH